MTEHASDAGNRLAERPIGAVMHASDTNARDAPVVTGFR
jgi:hypothetical protein